MSVFDGNSTTQTQIAVGPGGKPTDDYSVPWPTGQQIASPTALSPPWGESGFPDGPMSGMDVKVIGGDCWEVIQGTGDGNDFAKMTTHIVGTDRLRVLEDCDITVKGNLSQEVYGQTYYLYVDTSDINHIETVTVNYSNPVNYQQPTNWFQQMNAVGLSYDVQIQYGALNIQTVGDNMQFFATQLQIVIWNFNANLVNFNPDGAKLSLWGLDAKVNALGNKIHAIETKVGGAIAHAVATTVKTIIVGINQIF